MIILLCLIFAVMLAYYHNSKDYFWDSLWFILRAIMYSILLWFVWYIISFAFLPDTVEKNKWYMEIVSIADWNYTDTSWWWGFLYVSVNSENKIIYRYTQKLSEWMYRQGSLEGDVIIKEIEWVNTWIILVYEEIIDPKFNVKRYTPEWLMSKNPSRYEIVVPKWSVVKEFVFDNN